MSIANFLLTIATLASWTRSAPNPFLFPLASDGTPAAFSNLTLCSNDSMVVEYVQLPFTTAIGIGLECSGSLEEVNGVTGMIDNTVDSQPSGPCRSFLRYYLVFVLLCSSGAWQQLSNPSLIPFIVENTGKLQWNFSIQDITASPPPDYLPSYTLNFCRFMMYNMSIDSCIYGPWGLATTRLASNSTSPLAYSAAFKVLPANKKAILLTSEEGQTTSSKRIATTTSYATCPPTGIPSAPAVIFKQLDFWPPLAEHLKFPSPALDS
jgi:hypothetical protein